MTTISSLIGKDSVIPTNQAASNIAYQSDIASLEKLKSKIEEKIRVSQEDKEKQQHIPTYQVQLQAIEEQILQLRQKEICAQKDSNQKRSSVEATKNQSVSSNLVPKKVDIET